LAAFGLGEGATPLLGFALPLGEGLPPGVALLDRLPFAAPLLALGLALFDGSEPFEG
jgi:hypothetical protein